MASSSSIDKGKQPMRRGQQHSNPAVPAPFTPAPENVQPFLDTLDKQQVYITHIDIHPGWFKRRIFAVPVVLNLVIALLLGWRLYAAIPWYIGLVDSMVEQRDDGGYSLRVQFPRTDGRGGVNWFAVVRTVLKRALVFLLDYLLVTVVARWPHSFFLERPGNPMRWRTVVRFRAQEVVVRVSRGWGARELLGGTKRGGDSPFFRTRVAPHISRDTWLKTGYLLMGSDWDLDFAAMVNAHVLVDADKFRLRDLDKKVFAFFPPPALRDSRGRVAESEPPEGQWLVYAIPPPGGESLEDADFHSEATQEAGQETFRIVHQRLEAMGKEGLFTKWVELMHEEAERPGTFTKERQLEAGLRLRALFEEEGLDWDRFASEAGLPGQSR